VLQGTNGQLRMLALVAAAIATASALADRTATAAPTSGIDVQYIDHTVRPQDDFYDYVNGGWLKGHQIPPDAVRISAGSVVNDATQIQLRGIVEGATHRSSDSLDPDERKIATAAS
jgi:putative endopeptidase